MASSLAQKLYWASPYFVKCWLAVRHAKQSGRSRFGAEYEQILLQIAEHDQWTPQQFIDHQNEALRRIIALAAEHVPYYRQSFAEAGVDPTSVQTAEELSTLPILEKQQARESCDAMVDERLDRSRLLVGHTSGTTGTPLTLYRNAWQDGAAFAYAEARCHDVAGVRRRRNRSVSLGGHLVAAPDRAKPPFWVYNRHWDQLYMSSYHLSPANLPHYVKALREFRPEYIEGYPSSVYAIAQFIVESGGEPIPMTAAFTTAENLFDHQRDAIQSAFGCRTYSQYGCGERVVFASECEEGSMHLSPEVGIVEVVDSDGRPAPAGEQGDLVCTSLINDIQPFIRYRLGDVGSLATTSCPCGRPLPVLSRVEGRIDTVLITRDGRRIGRLDPVFKGTHGVAEAQIVQDDLDLFRIRIVPGPNYSDADGRVLVENLSHRTGPADIRIELVDAIERTANGKFLAVVSNLPQADSPDGK